MRLFKIVCLATARVISVLLLLIGIIELLHDVYHIGRDPSLLNLPDTKYVVLYSCSTFAAGVAMTWFFVVKKWRI